MIPILVINLTLIIKSYSKPKDVPSIGGWSPFIVLTGSMDPEIKKGDLIFVKQIDPRKIKENDIIAFIDPDGNGTSVLTHRVIKIIEDENGNLSFRTKGDANNTQDREAVSADKVIGIYRGKIPGAGNVAMFMQTTAGLVICVIVPLILLVLWDVLRRRLYDRKNQQDTSVLLAELEALKAAKAAEEQKKAEQSEAPSTPADAQGEGETGSAEDQDKNKADPQ